MARRAAVPQKKNFGAPQQSQGHPQTSSNDNFKPKYAPENKFRPQKPLLQQPKQMPPNTRMANQNFNQAQKTRIPNQEFKHPMQKAIPFQSTNPSTQSSQGANVSPQKPKPQTQNMKAQTQNTEPQQTKTEVTPKVKSQESVSLAQNKPQDNVKPAQTTRPQETSNVTQKAVGSQADKSAVTHKDSKASQPKMEEVAAEKSAMRQWQATAHLTTKQILDPTYARALHEELHDIMILVWQELTDDPPDEDHRFVVNKLRNEAGEDLRRVLGLNVTKRILDIHNKLIVKVHFTCRPQSGCLTSFLKKYHINKFKRIDHKSNTFAAQMDTIEDFDNLCATRQLICGEAKVTVKPCYKFSHCPENLKTVYDNIYFSDDTHQQLTESPKVERKPKAATTNENVTKAVKKMENAEAKSVEKSAITETKKVTNDSQTKGESTADKDKATVPLKTSNDNIEKEDVKSSENKTGDRDNVTKSKGAPKTIVLDDVDVESKIVILDELEDDDGLEMEVPENLLEGDEELDDEDILALMSEGVVLDECSGSEDECNVK